ncbi:MAG: hypothetical protein AAB932_01875, partial [Patescibacteria group bacterium]
EMMVIGDHVLIKMLVSPFTAIEIINAELAQSYREYAEILWNEKSMTVYGEEGARTLLNDTLSTSDVYWIGGNGGIERFHPTVWNEYKKKRIEKNVFWHDLIDPGMTLSGVKPGTAIYDEPQYEYKFLPETVAGPHVICIYGNKVANIVWKKDSMITIIDDADVAEGYKKYFHLLWQQEVTTYRGWEEIEKLFFKEIFPRETADTASYCIGGGYGEGGDDARVEEFYIQYNSMRTKKNIRRQVIFFEQHREKAKQEFIQSGDSGLTLVDLRFLPKEYYSPLQIQLIAGRAIVILWSKTPVATVYERKEIVDSFKKQFDLLWSIAKL